MDPKRTGNQSMGLISPSKGCWEIKGKIDDMSASELTSWWRSESEPHQDVKPRVPVSGRPPRDGR